MENAREISSSSSVRCELLPESVRQNHSRRILYHVMSIRSADQAAQYNIYRCFVTLFPFPHLFHSVSETMRHVRHCLVREEF